MEKRDLIVIVVAIVIVLIMAMYIKPLVTGKEVKIIPDELSGLFGTAQNETANNTRPGDVSPLINETNLSGFSGGNETNISANLTPTPTMTPTPRPTWNGTEISTEISRLPIGTDISARPYPSSSDTRYSAMAPVEDLKTYTTISGKYSTESEPIYIPSQYWELWYTVELKEDLQNPDVEDLNTDSEEGTVTTVVMANPSFSIDVIDDTSGQTIRSIVPEGGLNPKIWGGEFGREGSDIPETVEVTDSKGKTITKEVDWDPRPWKEKFYDGNRYFRIIARPQNLISYQWEIKIPKSDKIAPVPSANQSEVPEEYLPGTEMQKTVARYIEEFNSFSSSTDPVNLSSLFSYRMKLETPPEVIRTTILDMKNAGITMESYRVSDIFYRTYEGSLKGSFTWNARNVERQTPYDLSFFNESGQWKLDTVPVLRY